MYTMTLTQTVVLKLHVSVRDKNKSQYFSSGCETICSFETCDACSQVNEANSEDLILVCSPLQTLSH